MTTKPKVLIIGAGIGGLTAAIALRQAGFQVEVFERAAELKEIGAGLGLSANATRVLRMKFSDTASLRARLERDQCLSHLIIAELVSRGDPVEPFRDQAETLIRSNSFFQRSSGKQCRKKWFRDLTP